VGKRSEIFDGTSYSGNLEYVHFTGRDDIGAPKR
jgi:hypothetical protein